MAERIHDASLHGVLTDQEQFDATSAWASGYRIAAWVGDPSTSAGFQRVCTDNGQTWIDAENAVLPGIQQTAHDLAAQRLTIGDCPHLEGEMGGYVWDERKAALGEDAPVKARDHACDALRYGNGTPIATFGMLDAVGFPPRTSFLPRSPPRWLTLHCPSTGAATPTNITRLTIARSPISGTAPKRSTPPPGGTCGRGSWRLGREPCAACRSHPADPGAARGLTGAPPSAVWYAAWDGRNQ